MTIVIDPRNIRNTWLSLRKGIKTSDAYHQLMERSYPQVAGYMAWSSVAQDLAIQAQFLDPSTFQYCDATQTKVSLMAAQIAQDQAPVYWVDRTLLNALTQTDTPKFMDLERIHEGIMLFLFPEGWFKSPDRYDVRWVSVQQIGRDDPVKRVKSGKDWIQTNALSEECPSDRVITWGLTLESGVSYATTFGVVEGGDLDDRGDAPLVRTFEDGSVQALGPGEALDEEETEFKNQLNALVFQLLLTIQTRPDLILEKPVGAPKAAKKQRQPLLLPRWLGKGLKLASDAEGHHASAKTHWRRGHWKRVACGTGRSERQWRWIQPTLVSTGSAGEPERENIT